MEIDKLHQSAPWGGIFDNFGIKTVSSNDKEKNAYVVNAAQRSAFEGADRQPLLAGDRHSFFDLLTPFEDRTHIQASYYKSMRQNEGAIPSGSASNQLPPERKYRPPGSPNGAGVYQRIAESRRRSADRQYRKEAFRYQIRLRRGLVQRECSPAGCLAPNAGASIWARSPSTAETKRQRSNTYRVYPLCRRGSRNTETGGRQM